MPKFSDTVLLHINRYSDETKQIKRVIYESVLDTGHAPTVAEISPGGGFTRGVGPEEPPRPGRGNHHCPAEQATRAP